MYERKCNCGKNYSGKTGRNVTIRWDKHSNLGKNSGPVKYLYQFPEQRCNWKIFRKVPNKIKSVQNGVKEVNYFLL